MKKHILLLVAVVYSVFSSFAQAPDGFNYQAVLRNSSGALMASQAVSVKLSIINGTATSTTVLYSEVRNLNTTSQGLINIQVGSAGAASSTGSLATINWLDSNKFMKVEVDPTGGSSYTDFGTTQLMSVPYAAHSKQTSGIMTFGSGTTNADKMVIQHSPAYPTWGLQYSDLADDFNFLSGGTNVMKIALGSQNVNIGTSTTGTGKLNVVSASTSTPAMTVDGSIKAVGTNKFAFTATKTALNVSSANGFYIDNPLINGDPNAILVVTHNLSASSPTTYLNTAIGVYYDTGLAKWTIYTENSGAITNGMTFNVIAIK